MSYLLKKICLKFKNTKIHLSTSSLKTFSHIYSMSENTLQLLREKPIVVICGCTGTGKTKLSVELAKRFPNKAEILNADAMQVRVSAMCQIA
jgi:polynucleotide 5'-kinase involved in rRNA processing